MVTSIIGTDAEKVQPFLKSSPASRLRPIVRAYHPALGMVDDHQVVIGMSHDHDAGRAIAADHGVFPTRRQDEFSYFVLLLSRTFRPALTRCDLRVMRDRRPKSTSCCFCNNLPLWQWSPPQDVPPCRKCNPHPRAGRCRLQAMPTKGG